MVANWIERDGFAIAWVEAADGTRLRVMVRGDRGGRRVVFLHGFPQNAAAWRRVANALPPSFRVMLVDTRGVGGSDLSVSGRYDVGTLADDVARVVSSSVGGSTARPILVAHDWGGVAAWEYLGKEPQGVAAFVGVNAPHLASYVRDLFTSPSQLRAGYYTLLFQLPGFERWIVRNDAIVIENLALRTAKRGTYSPEDVALYVEPLRDPERARAGLAYYREAFRSLLTERGAFFRRPRIETPGVLLWGTEDRAIPPRAADAIVRRYAPNIDVRKILGATHWLPEEDPNLVATAIGEMSERHRR